MRLTFLPSACSNGWVMREVNTRIATFRGEPCTEYIYAVGKHFDG
jgi:hypothetical protein